MIFNLTKKKFEWSLYGIFIVVKESEIIVRSTRHDEVSVQKFLHGVGVPLVNGEGLHHLPLLVHQFYDGVCPPNIPA